MKLEELWHPYPKEKPTHDNEKYLVSERCCIDLVRNVRIAKWSENLYSVDVVDFKDDKHPGFYSYDSEFGYYEVLDVYAWMPCPLPYQEETK